MSRAGAGVCREKVVTTGHSGPTEQPALRFNWTLKVLTRRQRAQPL